MKRKRVIFWMIIFIPLLLVVPVNIVIIRSAQSEVNRTKEDSILENIFFVESIVNNLNTELKSIETYLRLLTVEEEYTRMLGYANVNQPGFWAAESQLGNDIRTFLMVNDYAKSVTIYFFGLDTCVNRDSFDTSIKKQNLDAFIRILKQEEEPKILDENGQWLCIQIGDRTYLGACYRSSRAACLVTVSLDELIGSLADGVNTDDYIEYFAVENEMFLSGKGRFYPEEDSSGMFRYQERHYMDARNQLLRINLSFGRLIDMERIHKSLSGFEWRLLLISIFSCLVGPMISLIFYIFVERPLKLLTDVMERIREGDYKYRIPLRKKRFHSEFDELNSAFNMTLDELERSQNALYQKEIDTQKIQLRHLNQQIRPHFILNALNIIYTYEDHEFSMARQMVLYLTKYFRYLVNLNSDYVYLYDEMEFVKTYLDIQKVRFPDRFVYFAEWEDDIGRTQIPAVIIQTFVENCIKYSFEKDKTVYIVILARKIGNDKLELTIADTGKGFDQQILDKIRQFLRTREYDEELGVGIQNVVNRLELLFGENYYIDIKNSENGGARVELVLPRLNNEKG